MSACCASARPNISASEHRCWVSKSNIWPSGFPAFQRLRSPSINLSIAAGSRIAVTGASGSGKSTFVNIITGLERVREGCISWNSEDIAALSESRRDRFRAANIGLVMQEFHLFPGLSAVENVLLPARLAHAATSAISRARP